MIGGYQYIVISFFMMIKVYAFKNCFAFSPGEVLKRLFGRSKFISFLIRRSPLGDVEPLTSIVMRQYYN